VKEIAKAWYIALILQQKRKQEPPFHRRNIHKSKVNYHFGKVEPEPEWIGIIKGNEAGIRRTITLINHEMNRSKQNNKI
jgi:hypothetical protein